MRRTIVYFTGLITAIAPFALFLPAGCIDEGHGYDRDERPYDRAHPGGDFDVGGHPDPGGDRDNGHDGGLYR